MATQFLDITGLTYYDSKLKEKVAGRIKIEGLDVSLMSISGAVLGKITIPQQKIELASASTIGLMSKEHFTKLEGIADGATRVEESETNGNVKINGNETRVYTPEVYTPHENGLYKVTVTNNGAVSVAMPVTKGDITNLGIPDHDTTYASASDENDGLMSTAHFIKLKGVEANAQVNVIEKVSVNGSALPINSKGVDIDLKPYALKTDITNVYKFKGSVDNFEALPKTDLTVGDVYDVKAAYGNNLAGTNFAWTGNEWDPLGGVFHVDAIATSDIDTLFA